MLRGVVKMTEEETYDPISTKSFALVINTSRNNRELVMHEVPL